MREPQLSSVISPSLSVRQTSTDIWIHVCHPHSGTTINADIPGTRGPQHGVDVRGQEGQHGDRDADPGQRFNRVQLFPFYQHV